MPGDPGPKGDPGDMGTQGLRGDPGPAGLPVSFIRNIATILNVSECTVSVSECLMYWMFHYINQLNSDYIIILIHVLQRNT